MVGLACNYFLPKKTYIGFTETVLQVKSSMLIKIKILLDLTYKSIVKKIQHFKAKYHQCS